MRHALALTFSVAALSVGMIGGAFRSSLVPAPGGPHLSPPTFAGALGRAGSPAPTARAERDQLPAVATDRELQVAFHRLLMPAFLPTRQASTDDLGDRSAPPAVVRKQRISMAVYSCWRP
jgi:hypothetical protein